MRITKREMVKDVFFLATQGKRTLQNFADGQYLIDMVAEHNYAWAIREWWNEVDKDSDNAQDVFSRMVKRTIGNLQGVNYNHTDRSLQVMRAYMQF